MAYNLDIEPGDMIVVPPNSGAQITVVEKSGRRTKLSIESAVRVSVLKSKDARRPEQIQSKRPVMPGGVAMPKMPRA